MCTFGNFFALVLLHAHTVNKLDLGNIIKIMKVIK